MKHAFSLSSGFTRIIPIDMKEQILLAAQPYCHGYTKAICIC
jgi:hypothetical protein